MSANIFGERFLGKREPAWHGLGTVFNEDLTASEAVTKGGLDYKIVQAPLIAHFDEGNALTGKYGIFRSPTEDDNEYRYIGVSSPNYRVLQNMDIAKVIDPLTEVWPVETVGALGVGETIFITLDAGDGEIKGEPIKKFFLLTDTRNGGTSMKIAFTPVRVVCQNTLVSGLKQSILSDAVAHNSDMKSILESRVNMLKRMQVAVKDTMASFEAMASVAISDEDVKNIFEDTFPYPKKKALSQEILMEYDEDTGPSEIGLLYSKAKRLEQSFRYHADRADKIREMAFIRYQQFCDEHNSIARTPWAAYNCIVELADFRGKDEEDASRVSASALFGNRAVEKKRAFASAMEYIK